MPHNEQPASRQNLIRLAESVREVGDRFARFEEKCDELEACMGKFREELAENRGARMQDRIASLEKEVSSLKDARARILGAVTFFTISWPLILKLIFKI